MFFFKLQEQFPLQNKLPRDLKMFLFKLDSSPKISKSDCWVLRILLLVPHTQIPLTSKAKVEGEYSKSKKSSHSTSNAEEEDLVADI